MAYGRLAGVIAAAVLGISGAWFVWASPDAPRWAIALCGIMACVGAAALLFLLAFAWSIVVDDLRPSVSLGRPNNPMAVSQREASMHGYRRYRHYPVQFWGVLTFNGRFLIGFMTLDKIEYVNLREDQS